MIPDNMRKLMIRRNDSAQSIVGQFLVMFEQTSKLRLIFFIAFIIGGIGACGQAFLLYHELVNNYPYKVIDFNFYRSIASTGVYSALIIAVICGFLFGLKRFWLAVVTPVVLCPLLFAVVFKTASVSQKLSIGAEADTGFGDFTPAIASQEFYSYAVSLAIAGLIVGGICSFLLSWLSRDRKLA
jgi:hypothetical protein